MTAEPSPERGWVAANLAAEFPELVPWSLPVAVGRGRTPREIRERMRQMSSRWSGPQVLALRQQPVPWAYRVFFRQIGLDPDETRTPVEDALVERLRWGGFRSRNRVADALLIAVVETGVPVLAFDGDALEGPVGLRLAYPGERLGGDGDILPAGQIVLSDAKRSLGVLFGELADTCAVGSGTERLELCAVQVKGVPEVIVDEALWAAAQVLGPPVGERDTGRKSP